MTEEIKPLVNTTKPWTQKLHDQWIHLFASPNPLCYPDVPFNTLTAALSQDYKLEVLVSEVRLFSLKQNWTFQYPALIQAQICFFGYTWRKMKIKKKEIRGWDEIGFPGSYVVRRQNNAIWDQVADRVL